MATRSLGLVWRHFAGGLRHRGLRSAARAVRSASNCRDPPFAGWRTTVVPSGKTRAAERPIAAMRPGCIRSRNRRSHPPPRASSLALGVRFLKASSARAGWNGTAFHRTISASTKPTASITLRRTVAECSVNPPGFRPATLVRCSGANERSAVKAIPENLPPWADGASPIRASEAPIRGSSRPEGSHTG